MKRRFVLAALPAIIFSLTAATKPRKPGPKPAAPPRPLGDVVKIEIVTELGTIAADLFNKQAPLTVGNIMRYVEARRYDGTSFYRAMKLEWGEQPNGLIQMGIRDPAKLFPPIPHEPTTQTGITHKAGTLSLARNAPGTARADFSILMSDLSGYDADPNSENPELRAGYCAFGQVVSGMDIARRIFDAARSTTEGQGFMKGQMLSPPIKVLRIRRLPD